MRWLAGFVLIGALPILGVAPVAGQEVVSCKAPKTPAEQSFCDRAKAYAANRPKLQAEAKRLMAAGTNRDPAHDCPNAQTTMDFNTCYGDALSVAEKDLSALEDIIRQLNDIPEPPNSPEQNPPGPAGPSLTTAQFLAEFAAVERSWRDYVKTACPAAFHQFGGGTGGPSAELECEILLTRNHMRELDVIYGMDLHL